MLTELFANDVSALLPAALIVAKSDGGAAHRVCVEHADAARVRNVASPGLGCEPAGDARHTRTRCLEPDSFRCAASLVEFLVGVARFVGASD